MVLLLLSALLGLLLFAFCFQRITAPANPDFRQISAAAANPAPRQVPASPANSALRQASAAPALRAALLFLGALALRLLFAACSDGFDTDTACYASWADRMFLEGPGGFYSPDVFTDYPPGYMYFLWPIGALRSLLGLPYYSRLHLILLKLPPIFCDIACGLLLYRESKRVCGGDRALFLCAAYLFNPAVLLNSSLWGQSDSVFLLPVICMCLALVHENLPAAYASFAAAFLIKPQAMFLLPVLFAAMLDQLFLRGFSANKLFVNLAYGLMTICGAGLLCAPFGLSNVLRQLFSTVSSYPYASVNAYNFWTLAGLNWADQNGALFGVPYLVWGFAAIFLASAVLLYTSVRHRLDNKKYPLLGAFLITAIFVFSVRMHERYLYPALLLLLLAYLYRPSDHLFLCYSALSVLHFCNTAHVLYFYDPENYNGRAPFLIAVSFGTLTAACYLFGTYLKLLGHREIPEISWESKAPSPLMRFFPGQSQAVPRPSARASHLRAADLICMLVLTALYSAFALYDLGDRQAPVQGLTLSRGDSIVLDFADQSPRTLSYYIAPWHDRSFSLEGKRNAEDEWVFLGDITLENVFTWQELTIEAGVPWLRLTLKDDQASLIELAFSDASGSPVLPVNKDDYAALFDEQELRPARSSFRNGMYFDEIYHGRTAYEFLHGLYSYENTHPPLGKILIAAGIALFGMNPFGWRIVGTLFGIAMVPLSYLFAKKITDYRPASALACVLFTFDFMHFTQTRLATIDVFITFFVMLMYFFMYSYWRMSFYDTPLWKTLIPLGACGISMGLGIAVKWTGVYAGVGLAVLFFSVLYRRYREFRYAQKDPDGISGRIPHERILKCFLPYTRRTILFCVGFFVLIPGLIYLLSYLPFRDATEDGLFLRMLHNQTSMFHYHSRLSATHPYSSPWYTWPFLVRPIWYYSGLPGGTLREGISAFGNPLVWWAGIPAFLYMLLLWARDRDRTAAFLSVAYLAQYLPWVFVSRITFIYHYFPCVLFVALMIVHGLLRHRDKKKRQYDRRFLFSLALYGAAAAGLFLLFYPVLSGQPVEAAYVSKWLRWFNTWVLAAG